MIARLHKSMQEKDRGFTLIELLVVVIIIGILAAIAIPMFMNQRKKAWEKQVVSDIRSATTAMEALATENNGLYTGAATYTGSTSTNETQALRDAGLRVSPDVTLVITVGGTPAGSTYTITGTHAQLGSDQWVYTSEAGVTEKNPTAP